MVILWFKKPWLAAGHLDTAIHKILRISITRNLLGIKLLTFHIHLLVLSFLQHLPSKQDGIRNREKVYNQSNQSPTFTRHLTNKTICGTIEGQCKKNVDRLPDYWYANSQQGCDQISHLSDINFLTLLVLLWPLNFSIRHAQLDLALSE